MILFFYFFAKQTFRLHIVRCSSLRTGGGEDTPASLSRGTALHHEVTPPPHHDHHHQPPPKTTRTKQDGTLLTTSSSLL